MILKDKVALITGAAQGIGKAIALKLADSGADVVIVDMNLEKAQATAKEIEGRGRRAVALKANVANLQETEAMIDETVAKLGAIHILVNNAGITRDALILRMKEEDWDAVISVNLKGVFNCTKAAVKHMAKQRYGRIINIASIVGEMGNAGQANYSASKAGVIALAKTVAREFASRNITCNAIAPGFIETAMTQALSEKVREELAKQIPMARLGTPEDVAEGVLFLVSDSSNYITGQVLNINGGMYM
ncbi:MAG: 3-oxoacyl-[acyl-carrier-protein] reductase [Deltaproteobacteria bacterium RBG_16_42_7]|nr:MAG: 3-oxoacyl-[acyl-carrier-protein] reductase [Deltaproteobacteria bacterium RBG_16_42_7]